MQHSRFKMSSGPLFPILVLFAITGNCLCLEMTTSRLRSKQKNESSSVTYKSRSNANVTYDVFDVRTPPRVKFQERLKIKQQENSHPGLAVPLDANSVVLVEEESTNKSADKSTTTWILLSGQSLSTTTVKPSSSTTYNKKKINATLPSTTKSSVVTPTPTVKKHHKNTVVKENVSLVVNKTESKNSNEIKKLSKIPNEITTEKTSNITLEAKDDAITLDNENTTKKYSSGKKKKNRRRKPSNKTNDSTGVLNPINLKDGPVTNQLYSYLSREIVPTLGVGLVGLVVTAGLASYFLYQPFGLPISRSDTDIDRKDDKFNNHFYYRDKYSGGMPEEEAIGEVIAGMSNNLFFKPSKNSQQNKGYRNNNAPKYQNIKGSVEKVPFAFEKVNERVAGYYEDSTQSQNDYFGIPTEKVAFTGENKVEELNTMKISEHGPRSLRN